MGTLRVDASKLSFQEQLASVARPESQDPYWEDIDEMEKSRRSYTHPEFDGEVTVEIESGDDRMHRPEVDDELLEQLRDSVRREHPSVPVESLSFDDLLELLLERAERYYELMDCELERAQDS
jgi:hypothetical protein